MARPLRLLLLEDRIADAELVVHELRQAGFDPSWQRVETAAEFLDQLNRPYDIILADYALPQFDALRALHLAKERELDVPFLVISGSISEEVAVECMKQGATDYLLKDRLTRLPQAVTRALELKQLRDEKRQAEAALRASEQRFRLLAENASDMLSQHDPDGMCIYASPASQALLGYAPGELVGVMAQSLVHPDDWAEFSRGRPGFPEFPDTRTATYRMRRKDGTYTWLETTCRSVRDAKTGAIVALHAVSRNVTERKEGEERLRASLKEKEVLLKEVQHRVKNNLQVISSLLSLQSGYVKDKQAKEMLKESKQRVLTIALIHEKLYHSKDVGSIAFAEYIRALADSLFHAYGIAAQSVALRINVNDVFLGVDTAIPCALIINELVSNSLKHAFPGGRSGEVSIDLHAEADGSLTLAVCDDGVGFPQTIDFRTAASLGMQLVNALAGQLGGVVTLQSNHGTTFTITFRELHYKERGVSHGKGTDPGR
jgi:PAS domain S-box-containing protein